MVYETKKTQTQESSKAIDHVLSLVSRKSRLFGRVLVLEEPSTRKKERKKISNPTLLSQRFFNHRV
jgi:hypothetical protein